jgi:hypothetical protein
LYQPGNSILRALRLGRRMSFSINDFSDGMAGSMDSPMTAGSQAPAPALGVGDLNTQTAAIEVGMATP